MYNVLAKFLYGESCLQADVARFGECKSEMYPRCFPVEENAAHFLFECENFNIERQLEW